MNNIQSIISRLNGKKIFITGGTGFFGKSLLDFLKNKSISAEITVLSRNPEIFKLDYPELAENITFVKGDLMEIPESHQNYDLVIHAAATVMGQADRDKVFSVIDEIISGTKNILEFSNNHGVKRILNISSGAVYGKQPTDIKCIPEEYLGSPDTSNPLSAYGEGKRVSELLCAINKELSGLEYVNARCFSFVGQYIPLNSHLAIGSFIGNGLNREDLVIQGDGTPLRSYMHTDDLVAWLLNILLFGEAGEAYNVGSDKSYSIKEVAECVCEFFPKSKVIVKGKPEIGLSAERYIPSIDKCKNQLGLKVEYNLFESVKKTVEQKKILSCIV